MKIGSPTVVRIPGTRFSIRYIRLANLIFYMTLYIDFIQYVKTYNALCK